MEELMIFWKGRDAWKEVSIDVKSGGEELEATRFS